MRRTAIFLPVLLVLLGAPSPARAQGKLAPLDQIRQGLALIQKSEAIWRTRRSCVSCHHQFLGAVTFAVAREQGVPVDEEMFARHRDALERQSVDSLFVAEGGINGQFGNSYWFLAQGALGRPPDRTTDVIAHFLAGKQHPDGSWRSESYRPPLEARPISVTALALRALQLYGPPGRRGEMTERIARAARWLEDQEPETGEDRSLRLLGLAWSNRDTTAATRELLAQQRDDGSWAQLATRAGDAYATGQALVALHQAGGVSWTDPAMEAGAAWLLQHREEDGSWHVATRRRAPGLLHFESGFPHGEDQFLSCAATCWASMALMLRESPRRSAVLMGPPSRITERVPDVAGDAGASPSLHFALAGGDADAVRDALANGADVNAANTAGATPLMAAVHDPALVRTLLDAGADPRLHAPGGISALVLAAGYGGALDSLKVLLEAAPPEQPELDLAFLVATFAGDRGAMELLLEAGADLDGPEFAEYRPVDVATFQNDVGTLQFLLEHGAPPDPPAAALDAANPLILAAESGFAEAAGYLLDYGADPLVSDDQGRTALHWAALVDPGHARMVALLLDHGADLRKTDDEGLTALDLARQEGSLHLVELLAGEESGGR